MKQLMRKSGAVLPAATMSKKDNNPRRAFLLQIAAGAVAVAGAPVVATMRGTGLDQPFSLSNMAAVDLAPYIGSCFRIRRNGAASLDVELIEIFPVNSGASRPAVLPRKESFVAVFRGEGAQELEQRTYWVEHRDLGRMHLFLGSSPAPAGGLHVEAVFG